MILSHFSDEPTITPRHVHQWDHAETFVKPDGLWVSVDGDDDWPTWCRDNEFRDTDAQHRHRVVLADDHRVLTLTNPAEVLAFQSAYAEPDPLFEKYEGRLDMRGINWARVAEHHQGIVIAPYQGALRWSLTAQWYAGWDCASGCIWDPAAIKEVGPWTPPAGEAD